MRKRASRNGVSIHAIAGTEVVLLGLDAEQNAIDGLLGFSIYRKKGAGKEVPLGGGKIFEDIHSEKKRSSIKSDLAPIQSFMWGDYSAAPNTEFTYRVVPVYGKPDAQKPGRSVSVTIKTEDTRDGTHGVFFNRGVAGSQAYARYFGKHRRLYKVPVGFAGKEVWKEFVKPEDIPDRKAYKWLSRGLEEALLGFIGQARGEGYGLRAAIYELTHMPAIQAFVDAFESGADVQIVHHGKTVRDFDLKSNKHAVTTVEYDDGSTPATIKKKEVLETRPQDSVALAAKDCISRIGLLPESDRATWKKKVERFDEMFTDRTNTTISHNKFIVLLKNGRPIQVWTGSTNLTGGGIYGQSNVGHIVRDEKVAQRYFQYWEKLHGDPKKSAPKTSDDSAGMKYWTVNQQPDLTGPPPPNSITAVFSPRASNAMLNWYADRLSKAGSSVHFTAAFSVANQIFEKVTQKKRTTGKSFQRYLLLEGIDGLMKDKYPVMASVKQNSIAWGETMKTREGDDQEIETLTGLNDHVNYLHTKYMLIDPLSDDPVVITGSANFSDASTVNNDENMLIIRGDTRVADIFLGEFMRLFNHFRARNIANAQTDAQAEQSKYLQPNSEWVKKYFKKGASEEQERLLFR